MHNTTAARDFSGKTLKALTEKGVRLIGKQAIPADENDRYELAVKAVLES